MGGAVRGSSRRDSTSNAPVDVFIRQEVDGSIPFGSTSLNPRVGAEAPEADRIDFSNSEQRRMSAIVDSIGVVAARDR
jgi:hypothetical protein